MASGAFRIELKTKLAVFFKVSSRPLFRFPKCKAEFRAFAPFFLRAAMLPAWPGQHLRRVSSALAMAFLCSWSLVGQFWPFAGIIVNPPQVCQRSIELLKVQPAAAESPDYFGLGNIVAALTH